EAVGDATIVQRYLAQDQENPVSIARSISAARENARSIREGVSLEVWQTINELYVFLGSREARTRYRDDHTAAYAEVQGSTHLALGGVRSTMLHDAPLDFIWLGVMLERLGQTARLLDVQHHALLAEGAPHPVLETALWLSLLRACSGFEAFMKRNRGRVTGSAVAAFLILEPRFPRSVRYCVRSARERLEAIRTDGELSGEAAISRLASLDAALAQVVQEDLQGARVHEVLTRVVDDTHAVCDAIYASLVGRDAPAVMTQSQSQ